MNGRSIFTVKLTVGLSSYRVGINWKYEIRNPEKNRRNESIGKLIIRNREDLRANI